MSSRKRPANPTPRRTVWTEPAERDLGRIYEYFLARTRVGTRTVVTGILATVLRLTANPEIGAPADLVEAGGDLRQFAWRHWLVFYRTRDDHVLVLRIWDSRRDPDSLQLPEDPSASSASD